MIEEREVEGEGGRLHVYDSGASGGGLVVVWHHSSAEAALAWLREHAAAG